MYLNQPEISPSELFLEQSLASVRLADEDMPPPAPALPLLHKVLNWHEVIEAPSTNGINESCPFKSAALTYAAAWWLRLGELVSSFLGCNEELSSGCYKNDIVSD